MEDNKEKYISEDDKYSENSAFAKLELFSNNGTPLPLIFKEIYGDRRLVFYTSKYLGEKYIYLINSIIFYYGENVIFCSDNEFDLFGGRFEWNKKFLALNNVEFKEGDFFFCFSFDLPKSVIDYVKSLKIKSLTCEVFRKAYIGALEHYIFKIRPVKNFICHHKNIIVILIDNFTPDFKNLTDWEKYLNDNKLTREKMVERLNNGENPYPENFYDAEYSVEDLISLHAVPNRTVDARGVMTIDDYSSQYVNVCDGKRVTVGQPEVAKRTVHVFGGCGFYGIGMPDKSTFASRLQSQFNEYALEEGFCVVNHGSFIWGKLDAMWYILNVVDYKDGDIIVLPYNQRWAQFFYRNIDNIIYADITQRNGGELFNDAWHPSENGIRTYATNLFTFIKEHGYFKNMQYNSKEDIKVCATKQYGIPPFANALHEDDWSELVGVDNKNKLLLDKYIHGLTKYRCRIGAIVMNCNPFTLGHRYLIEYAASRVDHLYIFAVEEDKSIFPFKDRFELICKGTSDIKNVTVLPSGKFIISSVTFLDYFGKSELQDKVIDASMDIEIFGAYIAPELNINVRFAGEEPLDNVTRQYNEQMKSILPKYSIYFEEVPRKEEGGEVISASRVRKLLQTKDFEGISKLVPKTTLDYLIEKFNH